MKVVFSPRCLEFKSPGHPESPDRVRRSHQVLRDEHYEFQEPSLCTDSDLLKVHTPDLVESVRENSFYDWDSPNLPHIYEFACLSAGGALMALNLCIKEGKSFSLMRPPGHHASRNRLGGFCYFNNIAVAVTSVFEKFSKIAILDFDCHHGNGTQAIFLGDERVLYISWHQTHIYPGTGLESQLNCLNFPLPPMADHKQFMQLFEKGMKEASKFNPELIAISAGFDSYIGDPLSMLRFEQKTYYEIGKKIHSFDVPSFAVLEGGYGVELSQCIVKFLEGFF